MEVIIRTIQPGDNAALAGIIRKGIEEFGVPLEGTAHTDPTTDDLFTLFKTPGSGYFVAEENGVVLGGGGFYPTDGLPAGCAELVRFFLSPAARGKGLGVKLLANASEAARKAGYTSFYLESFPEMKSAVRMYEKNGFKYLPAALGNSGHHACTIWMLKDL
ncbi:putative acetyltransferase [Chitinophaga jiangningensis]|uniref:Putative acetyltransferase n=1 Tax=Chitinophaga jiangningensis TaxID=1419482 RepID=A0A1M7ALZ2_9BACT|nr:GNAT family N-acetyltransferase [Chitinophaga jiangningensis]SHL43655.1 putative acetyltransferase [Chitinophaga jiangningensis]